jgi:hypothetical protein
VPLLQVCPPGLGPQACTGAVPENSAASKAIDANRLVARRMGLFVSLMTGAGVHAII